jgi:adenosine deaminase
VTSALDDLGVSRIDHGIRVVEDPAVLRRVADEGVTLDVALSSNLALLDPDIDHHPIRRLVAAGVPVTINTDDPVTLGVTLSGELALATRHLGWGVDGAVAATERAVAASFASPETAAELRAALRRFAPMDEELSRRASGPGEDP